MKRLLILSALVCTPAAWGQEDTLGATAGKCDSEIAWLSDQRPVLDNNRGAISKTAVNVDELFQKAKTQAAETGRLILWYIPQIRGTHMYRPGILDTYMKTAIFTDEAVVSLIKHNFVPFRACCTAALSKTTQVKTWEVVEPALLVLSADGKIVHTVQRIRTFNADYLHSILRMVLLDQGKYATPAAAARSLPEQIESGDYDRASTELMKKNDAASRLQLAVILRKLRMGPEALKLLDDSAPASLEKGKIHLASGRLADARAAFTKAGGPEAEYHLGLLDMMTRQEDSAIARWTKLAKDSAATRWGWKSAANLVKTKDTCFAGPASVGFEDMTWSGDTAYGLSRGTRWERPASDIPDVARRAVEALLRRQASTGAWTDSRYAYWESPKIIPNVRMAVTALAATALLEWRTIDPERIDAALALAEKYLLDDTTMARGENEECYADAYRLLYLARRNTPAMTKAMAPVIDKLAGQQGKDGLWAHEYPNPFTTAAIDQVLREAKARGAAVEDAVFARSGAAIQNCRADGSRVTYGGGGNPSNAKDSSARSAICESTLALQKLGSADEFQAAMDSYWKYLDRMENIRVCDFHSDGELGGFFFFHGFYHTTEAVIAQGGPMRDAHLAKFQAHLLKIPEIDGSFLDSHELGRSYATSMALLALKNTLRFKK